MKKITIIAAAGLSLIFIFSVATMMYKKNAADEDPTTERFDAELLERDGAPTKGSPDARVTIVEFFDPACGTCKAFHPFVQQLLDENPGKVRLMMRYAPLHHGSEYVVYLLEAAHRQDKFWETLEAAYTSQSLWASHDNPQPESLWTRLDDVGLDWNKTRALMNMPIVSETVKIDILDGKVVGANKTPTFFVNGKLLTDFGYEQLRSLVEAEIQIAY